MRMLAYILVLLFASSANAGYIIESTLGVDGIDLNLPSLPSSATAYLTVRPVSQSGPALTWTIGTFGYHTPSVLNPGQEFVLNETNAATTGVDWALLNHYLMGDVVLAYTIDASPLMAAYDWEWPPDYRQVAYSPRTSVLDLRFRVDVFMAEVYQGKNQGYVAGKYTMRFNTIPEPSTGLLIALGIMLLLHSRSNRQH